MIPIMVRHSPKYALEINGTLFQVRRRNYLNSLQFLIRGRFRKLRASAKVPVGNQRNVFRYAATKGNSYGTARIAFAEG